MVDSAKYLLSILTIVSTKFRVLLILPYVVERTRNCQWELRLNFRKLVAPYNAREWCYSMTKLPCLFVETDLVITFYGTWGAR